jgi:hypothetical protein
MSINTISFRVEILSRMDDGRWLTCGTGTLDGTAGNYQIIDCPADLGDDVYEALAAEINDTDGDISEVYHDVEMDDGREFRADVTKVLPDQDARYHVHGIPGGNITARSVLGDRIITGNDLAEIKTAASDIAGEWYYGVAIVDTDDETIDWGDEITDYTGNPV